MKTRKKIPFFLGSISIHIGLAALLIAIVFINWEPEVIDVPITLEKISLSEKISKVIHTAVHKMGLPHKEPGETATKKEEGTGDHNDASEGTIPPSEMQRYLGEVVQRINRTKQYPKDAQFNEQEGVVAVVVEIAPDGKILRSEIEKAAPYESLNKAALAAVGRLGVLPPLPMTSTGKPVSKPIQIHIPIHFRLK